MINTALRTENLEEGSAILICQTVDEWLPSLWIEALEILISQMHSVFEMLFKHKDDPETGNGVGWRFLLTYVSWKRRAIPPNDIMERISSLEQPKPAESLEDISLGSDPLEASWAAFFFCIYRIAWENQPPVRCLSPLMKLRQMFAIAMSIWGSEGPWYHMRAHMVWSPNFALPWKFDHGGCLWLSTPSVWSIFFSTKAWVGSQLPMLSSTGVLPFSSDGVQLLKYLLPLAILLVTFQSANLRRLKSLDARWF